MVRGDTVHGAVQQASHQGVPVFGGADGRVHLEPALVLQVLVAHHQIVGAGLAGDGQALGLGGPDEGHGLLGGDVAHMVAAAGLSDQPDVPFHLFPLAGGGVAGQVVPPGEVSVVDGPALCQQALVLAVGHDGLVQRFGKGHGGAHHLLGLDAPSVVGEACHIGGHGRQVCQCLALLTAGDGTIGIHMDFGVFPNQVQLDAQILQTVGYRLQIGHSAHGGIAAGGGSRCAGVNRFLIRKTRFPKMNMNINETWNDQTVMQFNDGKAFLGKGGGNGNNTALVNGEVHILKASVQKNGSAGQQQIHVISPSSSFSFDILYYRKSRFLSTKFPDSGCTKSGPESGPLLCHCVQGCGHRGRRSRNSP